MTRAVMSAAAVVVASLYVFAGVLWMREGWRLAHLRSRHWVLAGACFGLSVIQLSLLWQAPASSVRTIAAQICTSLVLYTALLAPHFRRPRCPARSSETS